MIYINPKETAVASLSFDGLQKIDLVDYQVATPEQMQEFLKSDMSLADLSDEIDTRVELMNQPGEASRALRKFHLEKIRIAISVYETHIGRKVFK